jgi:enoyl-CoA hydratase/carnithine racemase
MRVNLEDASGNGSGSGAWARPWTLRVDRPSPGCSWVTFDHPPINAITATTVAEPAELVGLIEAGRELNVVVFGSVNRGGSCPGGDQGDRRARGRAQAANVLLVGKPESERPEEAA